ncbi:MAG: bifunctional nuclease family protein [Bacteroidota bacterium]
MKDSQGTKIRLEIMGITYSQTQSGAYALILGEAEGKRRLPIIIGGFEAQAIAIELEKMRPTRPLTHDLFKSFSTEFNINVFEVLIHKFAEGVFYSKLVCESQEKIAEIDSRTSDAVALAVRFNCPIYTYENVLEAAGVALDETKDSTESGAAESDDLSSVKADSEFSDMNLKELEEQLTGAIDDEDYEKASRIRDEITKKKEKKSRKGKDKK